jgi:hypothetical protein
MVTRPNLLAAISDSDAWKRVATQNAGVITSLELRLGKFQRELACEQAKTAQCQSALREMTSEINSIQGEFGRNYEHFSGMLLELAEVRSKIREMCSKSELCVMHNRLVAAEEQQASERSEHERALAVLHSLLASRNQENSELLSSAQVHGLHSKSRQKSTAETPVHRSCRHE